MSYNSAMPILFKKITAALVLASFVTIVFFSFIIMMHAPGAHGQNGCPFSTGVSFCPQDAVALVTHHISAYQSFLNATIPSGTMTLLASLLLAAFAFAILYLGSFLFAPPSLALAGITDGSPPVVSGDRKIIRWLSLFENSPSR